MAAWQAPMKSNGVYWIGADGKVYVKGALGTNAAGTADANTASYWGSRGYGQINDPVAASAAVAPTAPSNPNGGSASVAAVAPKVDKSNDIALNQAGLGAVDTQLNSGLGAVDKALNGLYGQYDTEATQATDKYNSNSTNNTLNLQKNKQTAYVNAAQGRSGLFGSLSSLGALSGDGITLANRAVQKGANDDLSGAADSYDSNKTTLDDAIGSFRNDDERRRKAAADAAENARTNVRADAAKSRMSFYSNISNDYAAMGDEGNAKDYSSRAASLYPEMARNNVPNSNIAYSGAAFTPGQLSSYMAGTDSTVTTATPTTGDQGIPGLVATPTTKKKQLLQLV